MICQGQGWSNHLLFLGEGGAHIIKISIFAFKGRMNSPSERDM